MARLLAFEATQSELEAAWAEYDAAQLRVRQMYENQQGSSRDRMLAAMAATRLHEQFVRTMRRLPK